MTLTNIEWPEAEIAAFCGRWQIRELSLFGSVLRDDFRPDSDVDLMASFQPEARFGIWDLEEMRLELEQILGRPVDFIEKEGLRNSVRKKEILSTAEVVYVA